MGFLLAEQRREVEWSYLAAGAAEQGRAKARAAEATVTTEQKWGTKRWGPHQWIATEVAAWQEGTPCGHSGLKRQALGVIQPGSRKEGGCEWQKEGGSER
ncbi:hypothetical protein NDU88_003685 [Pleurodeles waltl]|uniref:Uncharacterized protein n=1 Tax=Pleurodeles waltl TaxID=8319 RepID=A0AAV7KVJ5_PLEWA|nr:hypothetical protein NDU88_003682 [Pleurodeles waltl]KAJ1083526.1 hypothetical protein NDU88_003685 [Pleurodeles waltl]